MGFSHLWPLSLEIKDKIKAMEKMLEISKTYRS